MQIVVLNGTLSEREQDAYIKQATARYPVSLIEKLILDVQKEYCETDTSGWRWRLFLKDTAHMMQKPGNGLQENRLVRLLRSPFLVLLGRFFQHFSQLHGVSASDKMSENAEEKM